MNDANAAAESIQAHKIGAVIAAAGAAAATGALLRRRATTRQLVVRRHALRWPVAAPLRVVHLTDLHVGRATPRSVLDGALERAHALAPDLVVLTGDYLNHSLRHLERLERFVAELPRPCVATLGNHDHYSGAAVIAATLERAGIDVLRNRAATLSLGEHGAPLRIIGVGDVTTGNDDIEAAFAEVAAPERALVLTHAPNLADALAARGARLILAGHTHAGQLHSPRIERALRRLSGQRYLAGWYDVGAGNRAGSGDRGARLYVNAGIGASALRLRLGSAARPEVALFELTPG